ncbi:hypothetical protein P168DRAFT_261112 [Aspergillus campestris IBT 28561]|uniref:Rhodopsin domain-containing protein n=1 Tax=Aspergillus campestris (strain IBT 28561) TaxID=1392248 RepID=A0A2I1CQG2_ASPC2|nr:uncharacterized protein P168DRAFT_261112 [Aspergillus campestris IBT 28561]PKX99843.1 hypothetical protein P168DRAFT_261112 [Aspergillus campestris IBT 28561]
MGNDDSLQRWAAATTIAVTVLAFVSVCLRLLSRWERKQKLWWDDWIILWSMAWNFVVVGFIFAMIHNGMGLHADTVDPENIVLIAKFLVVAEILYVFNLVWTKISILFMYYRIFHFPYFKRWAYGIGTFIICWVITITFLFVFICVPVEKLWYPQLPGHCINQVATWIANATSTIATDLVILFLPMPQIWKLQLRTSEKVGLTIAFGLGFFVVFASAYRLTVLFSYTPLDSSYTLAPTVAWTAIEMSAGIVSACLPTMRPALQAGARLLGIQHAMPALLRSRTDALSKGQSSGTRPHDLSMKDGSRTGTGGARRHSFYYLPDENDSQGEGGHESGDLRPGYDCGKMTTDVRVSRASSRQDMRSESCGDDEVPLRGIRVQKNFVQVNGGR